MRRHKPKIIQRGFNPRAREGRDDMTELMDKQTALVSIHAPARGATSCYGRSAKRRRCFNPRAREGRDGSSVSPACMSRPSFNPRAREGRDR